VTENVTIAQGYGLVTYTPVGSNETAIGFANVSTAILTSSDSALETIYLTMQPDASLAGSFSRVGYGGGCSEEGTITAVLGTSPPPVPTLTGLSISGWSSISEYGTNSYTATASWSDNSKSTVTSTWSVNSQMASISPYGVFSCQGEISSDQTVTITATYSSGGITKTATMDVTIKNFTGITNPFPDRFTEHFLSGMIFFDEKVDSEGKYESSLYMFHEDFSFEQYIYEDPPVTSNYLTGTWSIDVSGEAILNYSGGKTIAWKLLDLWLTTWISVDNGTGTPSIVDLEMSGPGPQPFDGSLIRGTYVDQYGDTWIFNSNGTGSTTNEVGSPFTWSVDDGNLKVVFPNGYVGWMYQRPSENNWTDYPVMEWAFVLYTPTGNFSSYYGGMRLIRQ
jgi:hypothetical protein